MDIATLVGLVSGVTLVIVSILMGGNPGVFWSSSSVVIVMGGTLAATLINFPLGDVLSVMNTVKNAFFHKDVLPESLIPRLVSFATIARREGILALESHASEAEDEFLEKSVQLAIDGTAPELIKDRPSAVADRGQAASDEVGMRCQGRVPTLFALIGLGLRLPKNLSDRPDIKPEIVRMMNFFDSLREHDLHFFNDS
ncbi:MAG TPA: hypothetical protein PKZ25_04085, partial [Candidatus Hydrogenedentes bacterium]|nr:hypothetical protein [Candidatus Hydrogenedentota bacterium]